MAPILGATHPDGAQQNAGHMKRNGKPPPCQIVCFTLWLFGRFRLLESGRQVHFTCGPSRTEAEHPQPRFGHLSFAKTF